MHDDIDAMDLKSPMALHFQVGECIHLYNFNINFTY